MIHSQEEVTVKMMARKTGGLIFCSQSAFVVFVSRKGQASFSVLDLEIDSTMTIAYQVVSIFKRLLVHPAFLLLSSSLMDYFRA